MEVQEDFKELLALLNAHDKIAEMLFSLLFYQALQNSL